MSELLTNPPSSVPAGIKEAIEAAGHQAVTEPDGWLCDDLAAVQAIIAAYSGSAAELKYWQAQTIEAVQAQYASLIAAGCIITVNGTNYTMALDSADLQHYDAEALTALTQGQPGVPEWDPNEFWLAADDVTMIPMATATAAITAAVTIRTYFKALVKNAATLVGQISAATSVAQVQAISPASGWPSNP